MKAHLLEMVNSLINNDSNAAADALKAYLSEKSKVVLEMDDSDDNESITIQYAQGMKGTVKEKTFKNQGAFDKWFEKNEGDVEIHRTSRGTQD